MAQLSYSYYEQVIGFLKAETFFHLRKVIRDTGTKPRVKPEKFGKTRTRAVKLEQFRITVAVLVKPERCLVTLKFALYNFKQ